MLEKDGSSALRPLVLGVVVAILLIGPQAVVRAQYGPIQVPEIPSPNLPDIAMVVGVPPVIYYNPIICNQVGPRVCGFFRTHEYGHVVLGHTLVPNFPPVREAQADCWAAGNGSPYDVLAAYEAFLYGGLSSQDWWTYGNPAQRAGRLRTCAIRAGNWLGR